MFPVFKVHVEKFTVFTSKFPTLRLCIRFTGISTDLIMAMLRILKHQMQNINSLFNSLKNLNVSFFSGSPKPKSILECVFLVILLCLHQHLSYTQFCNHWSPHFLDFTVDLKLWSKAMT